MQTEKRRTEPRVASSEPRSGLKHKLPDPPDPDNLPIDYPGAGWDSSSFPSATPRTLRPQHYVRGRSTKP
ncbi:MULTISPECIES: hypothetical protein [Paenarthrobacter]|jgi:hypothetical protein|uniref:hypothetical protein n=1 Tax=Paenarthrobacter TaxID=1742992 RepID=UPI0014079246|nr:MULTISPECIES: hypothetical protein [Paenarthrobacter]MCX8456633.1 hypothetical protein [Paenarthrobacter ureafaciens]MCY0974960.1 hypothetical protein [Paenarthrobacter ureafaciens]QOT18606.1 hypothetical protein HMI59_19740 [Paenarthrobacter sp. YJN-5]QQQ62544.1 hypothetical protein JHQ56_01335 [Paenarthrobacter ureafaciens]